MTSPVSAPVSRRLLLAGSLSAALLGGLVACSDDESAPPPEPSPTPSFPVTVEHMYGTTTVKAEPQRIVVVGYTEQDTLLALGVVPIATTQWVGDVPYAVFPWAVDKLGDAKPTVLESAEGLSIPAVTKLKPDLIIGTNAGLSQEDYTALSKIAPTIANSGVYGSEYYEPWPTQTVLVGQGRRPGGPGAEAGRRPHPAVRRGRRRAPEVGRDDGRVRAGTVRRRQRDRLARGTGHRLPHRSRLHDPDRRSTKFVDDQVAQAQISAEDVGVLNDAEVLVWATDVAGDGADIQQDKILGKLDAVKEGRSVYSGEELASAIYFSSILSLPTCSIGSFPSWRRSCRAELPAGTCDGRLA